MPLPTFNIADYQAVFDHFGIDQDDRPAESYYAYAPVFRTTVDGVPAAVKRTRAPVAAQAIARWVRALAASGIAVVTPIETPVENPALIDDEMWVAYPWIDGRTYDGSAEDIAAAGELLGRVHAFTSYFDDQLPAFDWPDHDEASVKEDIDDLSRVLPEQAPEIAREIVARNCHWHRSFMTETLPPIRDNALPLIAGTTDYKANNLVYGAPSGPVLIDPDNADYLPRILDLALAALLFHNEIAEAPARLFTSAEWDLFGNAYSAHAKLTELEVELWPTAFRYVITEWGTWTLVAAEEWGDWADPRKRAFLTDLAAVDPSRFALGPAWLDRTS